MTGWSGAFWMPYISCLPFVIQSRKKIGLVWLIRSSLSLFFKRRWGNQYWQWFLNGWCVIHFVKWSKTPYRAWLSLSEKYLFYISYSISLKCPCCSMMHNATCFSVSELAHMPFCTQWRQRTYIFLWDRFTEALATTRQQQDTGRCCNPVEENKFLLFFHQSGFNISALGEDNTIKNIIGTFIIHFLPKDHRQK